MRFAVLASGNGTNFQALLDAEAKGELAPGRIALLVCNRPDAFALDRAIAAGIEHRVIDHRQFSTREAFEDALLETLAAADIDAVILAGFMRILTDHFVKHFDKRILNTHPALCPAFPGVNAPQQAIDHGVKITGCTVHFVDAGIDTGPIVFQEAVAVAPDDDARSLHERIQRLEHALLPRAAQLLAAGRLRVIGRKVEVDAR